MENNTFMENRSYEINKQNKDKTNSWIVAACICFTILALSWTVIVAYLFGSILKENYIDERSTGLDVSEHLDREYNINEISPLENYTESALADMVEKVMPSMVAVNSAYDETVYGFWGETYQQESVSCGSGIIVGSDNNELLIATNYHVIAGSKAIEIQLIDGTIAPAYLRGENPQMDLAVISIMLDELDDKTIDSIAVAKLGNSESLRLGETVIAIGNSLGYGQSVTTGVVSALGRDLHNENGQVIGQFIQTDAAINPGNSGGALLNVKGEVVGINSNKIGGDVVEGMGFAIPISEAEPIINDLSEQSTKIKVTDANKGYLGVITNSENNEYAEMYGMPQGVFLSDMDENGPAYSAGIQKYDIIVRLEDYNISNFTDLTNALQYYEAGETVEVEVMRLMNGSYASITFRVTLANVPTT